MSRTKRYYFFKVYDDFLLNDEVSWLMEQEDGPSYICLYFTLCIRALKHDGRIVRLVGEQEIPYDVKGLAKASGMSASVVKCGVDALIQAKLLTFLPDKSLYITNWEQIVGSETDSAQRMRKKRQQMQSKERVKRFRNKSIPSIPESL